MTELSANSTQPAPAAESLDPALAVPTQGPKQSAVRLWQGIFGLILLVFVILLGARLVQTNQSEQRASGVAPAFQFTTFEGETISSADLLGKGVVLNFWASWCDPCREEATLLEATWRREQENGIVFIGLDYLDQEPAAKAYLAEFGITYPNGPDLQSAAARRYGIKGVPETFFIDPQGNITDIVIGPIVNQAQMDDYLQKIRP
jgi:cytochrome c biogenesis protein CcmG/thiol:disulfide interchange protein DsbE